MESQKEVSDIFQKMAYLSMSSSVVCILILISSSFFLMKNVDEINFEIQLKSKQYLVN